MYAHAYLELVGVNMLTRSLVEVLGILPVLRIELRCESPHGVHETFGCLLVVLILQ